MRPLQPLFDILEYLVDDQVGIIHDVQEIPREPGAPDFFHFFAQAGSTLAFSKQDNSRTRIAGGASAHREKAMAKAIGEAVERYCSALYDAEEFPFVAYASASFSCIKPSEFALYSCEQYESPGFPFIRFDERTPVRWVPAQEMTTGDLCYVPAAMVFVPYSYDKECGECPITQPISTGLACHGSWEEAALSAICEVIERDAFTIAWQARLGMPQIRLGSLSDGNRNLVARFERTGSEVTMFDLTLDHGIPTILSALRGTSSEVPGLAYAASSHPDPEQAVCKSLEELAHTRAFAYHLKAMLPPLVPGADYGNVVKRDDHVRFYCDHANAHLADFIFGSDRRVAFQDIPCPGTGNPVEDLRLLIERIYGVNQKVLLYDLTTPDVGELGLRVIRAVIPGFHRLALGHRIRALGGSRLWEVPQKLGYPGITRESGDNPVPHPYP
jgi:ribosomal protein S12 methylthiotransferase accessory factor